MGSVKALLEWCRIQCEDYKDVEMKDMSTSFRDGLAFCAIIHRHKPNLIDFDLLSKENVYENNRLAFEVAETQLGIPALLDPEYMVSMKVPDRLSIITYVSQYYHFFNKNSKINPPCVKIQTSASNNEADLKRFPTSLDDKLVETESAQASAEGFTVVKHSTLSSSCVSCQKHVHLVQRFLVDGKLYHRNCFRCAKCHSTLVPGSYKLGNDSGALVCTHHLTRHALTNLNEGSDPEKTVAAQSAGTGWSTDDHVEQSEREQAKTFPTGGQKNDDVITEDFIAADSVVTVTANVLDNASEISSSSKPEEKARPFSPSNPFDESDEEDNEEEGEQKMQIVARYTSNGDLPSTLDNHPNEAIRPVPAPRRVSEPRPLPHPAPRIRLPDTVNGLIANEQLNPQASCVPGEQSLSPESGIQKPKDPPWLALVQSDSKKKKKAPLPPPAGLAGTANTSSLSSRQEESATPSQPSNPFEEDENGGGNEEQQTEEEAVPPTVVTSHPWYNITRTVDSVSADTSPAGDNLCQSFSPESAKKKKRPAPPAPQPSTANPALSIESFSSGSDHCPLQLPLDGRASSSQEQGFTKSVSEPSICSPCDSSSTPSSSSADCLQHTSLSPYPSSLVPNISSAPSTPRASRNSETKSPGDLTQPIPTSDLLVLKSHNKMCKENPFNRKASPSGKSQNKPTKPPVRLPAPGHGFPLIKRKVQSDQYIPPENIYMEMAQLEKQLDELEQRGVGLEKMLRDSPNDEDEEHLLVHWFTLIHEKHLLVRREAELVYMGKQQNLEERQANVEYELRCLLNKPEKDWVQEDIVCEQELMAELITIIDQRNQIVNNMDQDRQREEEEDKLVEVVLEKKNFHKSPEGGQQKKKGVKFKPIKVLKRLSHKGEPEKSHGP